MELALLVYGIETLDNASVFISIGIAICVLASFGTLIATADREDTSKHVKAIKWLLSIAVIFSAIQVVLPTKKTAYTMVAAYAAQSIYNNPKVEQMSGKVLKIIDQKLEEYIAEGEQEIVQRAAQTSSSASQSK